MKIQIKETGTIDTLTILDENNIDWTADLITAGSLERNDDGIIIMAQDDFDWWTNYINAHDKTESEVEELAELLEENEIECPDEYGWLGYINHEIGKNTGNDYDNHRNEALEILAHIKKDYLYPQVGQIVKPTGYSLHKGEWKIFEINYKPDNHNILIQNTVTSEKMWISYNAID